MEHIMSHYKIICHRESAVLEIIWKGESTSDEFRRGSLEMLEALKSQNLSKVIVDMEWFSFSVTQEDHEWFKQFFIPMAVESNLKTIAFVEPGVVNTLSIANILYPYFPGFINFEIFDSFELASKWIISQ